MTLLQIPLVITNSVSWALNETTCTYACSHIQTCKHKLTYHDEVDTVSTWDLGREVKKGIKSTGKKEMCLKLDTASFLPCTVAYEVHMYINSQDGSSILCSHSVFAHCIERTQRDSSPARTPTEECREHWKDGEMGRYLTFSWGSQRGESSWAGLWLRVQSVDSDETLQNIRRDFDNTISSPPAAAKA